MPTPAKLAGKAGTIEVNGTFIAFKTIKPKTSIDLADSTDSSNYDVTSNLVHKSQIACTTQLELSIEGFFDLNSTASVLLTKAYVAGNSFPVIINLNATAVYGHGNFDISDFEASIDVNDMVTFTCTLKSNGIFIQGS